MEIYGCNNHVWCKVAIYKVENTMILHPMKKALDKGDYDRPRINNWPYIFIDVVSSHHGNLKTMLK